MRKFIPMIIACITVMLLGALIVRHETQLAAGTPMYAKLAPVDPRSLIQGDYMQLGYALVGINDVDAETVEDHEHGKRRQAWVMLDDANRIVSADWQASNTHSSPLMLTFHHWQWHPATDSFLFAEGLGECYGEARYAKLSVADDGQAMLVDLVDENLQVLNCQDGVSWWQGTQDPSH